MPKNRLPTVKEVISFILIVIFNKKTKSIDE